MDKCFYCNLYENDPLWESIELARGEWIAFSSGGLHEICLKRLGELLELKKAKRIKDEGNKVPVIPATQRERDEYRKQPDIDPEARP